MTWLRYNTLINLCKPTVMLNKSHTTYHSDIVITLIQKCLPKSQFYSWPSVATYDKFDLAIYCCISPEMLRVHEAF